MKVIKRILVYSSRKYKKFAINLQTNKIQLNYFQHGYLTSAPNFCSKIQSTIQ